MKNSNKNQGITLIALVITIIVMLILVAVTITMAVNGGLFDYAKKAAADTNTRIAEEQDWANIGEGQDYEQLTAKYTRENPDLAKLKRYYIDGDETAIDSESIQNISAYTTLEIIEYNSIKYIITKEYDESIDAFKSIKVEQVDADEVVVTSNNGYIRFSPEEGQTWLEWAESDGTDLPADHLPSLKELIISKKDNEGDDQRKIVYSYMAGPRIGVTRGLSIHGGDGAESIDSTIIPGSVYRI